MSRRMPVWKHRVTFSKNRNVSVVLWPPGEWQGHPTPPNIVLEEGSYNGKNWNNTRMTLTLDKLPNIVQDLMIAYSKALELQTVEAEAEVAEKEMAKPTDPVGYLKTSILETLTPGKVYPQERIVGQLKDKHSWPEATEVEQAISQLVNEGRLKPKLENLTLMGFFLA